MSVGKLLFLTLGLLIAALAAQAFVAVLQAHESAGLEAATARRHASFVLADELRQSSDELTRFARTYAVTGDERFKRYFRTVLEIRNGDAPRPVGYEGVYWDFVTATHRPPPATGRTVALLDLMREAGFTTSELDLLREAARLSDSLVGLEDQAMDAMEGRFLAADGRSIRQGDPDPETARSLLHGADYHLAKAAIMKPVQEFLDLVDARTSAEVQAHHDRAALLRTVSIGIAIVAALLAFAALLGVLRRVLGPVGTVSDRLQTMAGEMNRASGEQQVGASEQSASVEETRQTFSGLLDATRSLAEVGTDVLQNAELSQRSAQTIAARIGELSASTRSITEVLGLVKDIANKSEVLALNAALEGTKAGEAGRGFSLVAAQMKRLAERVMTSVKKIETLTGAIEKTSRNAVLAAEEAEKVATLTTHEAREIAEAVNLQQAGAQQVATAMDEIAKVAGQNVDAARDTVSAANDLMGLAERLRSTLHGNR